MDGPDEGRTPGPCQERALEKPNLHIDSTATGCPLSSPRQRQEDLVTALLNGFLDLKLMQNETLGRIEMAVMSTPSKADLDPVVRHLARLDSEVRGLRGDVRAAIELVQDLAAKRVPVGAIR